MERTIMDYWAEKLENENFTESWFWHDKEDYSIACAILAVAKGMTRDLTEDEKNAVEWAERIKNWEWL